jgi:hypothetical protein
VEPRRQGGRLVSRWLREEKGGREEQSGGEKAAQPQSPAGSTSRGPTGAEVAHGTRHNSSDKSDPNKPKLITSQNQLLSNYSELTTHLFPFITNHCGPSHIKGIPDLSVTKTSNNSLHPALMIPDSINNHVSTIYDTPISHQNRPITINFPETAASSSQLLPNQTLTFSSQPVIKVPPKITSSNKKHTRGPSHAISNRPKNNPALTQINLPDPKITQTKPENKKPKTNITKINPTQNPADANPTQEKEDMEVQGEKKRRREEERSVTIVNNEEIEHFLTAGPGSQDCRD